MKKILFVFFVLASFGAYSQAKIKSAFLADSISIGQGAIEIKPVIVTAEGDTARSLNWVAYGVYRDNKSIGCNLAVLVYDKKGRELSNLPLPVPAEIVNNWGTDPAPIDDYIFYKFPRLKKN